MEISDADVTQFEKMQRHDKEYLHGQLAVEAAKIQGIFPQSDGMWSVNEEENVENATQETKSRMKYWHRQLVQLSAINDEWDMGFINSEHTFEGEVLPIYDLLMPLISEEVMSERVCALEMDVDILTEEQKQAYDIIDQHLQETLSGKMPPQLLMIIPGKGVVGK